MIPEYIQLRILRSIRSNSRFDAAVVPGCYLLTSTNELGTKTIWTHTDFPVFNQAIAFLKAARVMKPEEINRRVEKRLTESKAERIARIRARLFGREAA